MHPIPAGLVTPTVIIDSDVLHSNVERMASGVRERGLNLRPHAKTHKILEIAALQLAAGAVGLTVATIGEAEVFAAGGVADLFIAYPLWIEAAQAERLLRLQQRARVSFGIDSAEAAAQAARSLGHEAARFQVLIEIDCGHHRSGVSPDAALGVADAARGAGLDVVGVFTFPGHGYGPGKAHLAAMDEGVALELAASLLRNAGHEIAVVSGGSTPTALLSESSTVTETRPGVYVFGDAQQLELGKCGLEHIALTVVATVVSRGATAGGAARRIVLDAGSKVLGSDRPMWATGFGRVRENPEARMRELSEHHATVEWLGDAPLPELGQQLRVIPNHVCVCVNLVDDVTLVSRGAVVGRWAVGARGKNS